MLALSALEHRVLTTETNAVGIGEWQPPALLQLRRANGPSAALAAEFGPHVDPAFDAIHSSNAKKYLEHALE